MTQTAQHPASQPQRRGFPLRRLVLGVIVALVLGSGAAELAARTLKVGDFPIYQQDAASSYVMQANQSGSFMGKYAYAVNEQHMGVADKFPADGTGILLIGDSIVLGGNQVDQADRLGPQLSKATGCQYWPISASSWALANEIGRLFAQPDLMKVQTIVIVSNDGDFGEKSRWQNQYAQPTEKPLLLSLYAMRKYLGAGNVLDHPYSDAPDPAKWLPQLVKLRQTFKGRIVVVGYPDKLDLEGGRFDKFDIATLPTLPQLKAAGGIEYVPVLGNPAWTVAQYKDNIHPTAPAYHKLAAILAPKLGTCSSQANQPASNNSKTL